MDKKKIIVIGASAGGFEVIKKLIGALPPDLNASIFVVWHMSPDVRGILPQVLNRLNTLPATHAKDNETIEPGHVYIAPPDHHMLLEKDLIRVTRGPKENQFRPAVDPLFRSAAFAFRSRVIGVILSGALDDGTAGLWAVKHYGGAAIVQDPEEAEVRSMPDNAIKAVKVDFVAGVDKIADLLVRLVDDALPSTNGHHASAEDERLKAEISIAMEDNSFKDKIAQFGDFTPFTCPECHGVLMALKEGERTRFRCHTGHAFSADSLLSTLTEGIEEALWNAIRSIQESVILLNHLGDHFAEVNQPKLAAMYFKKAKDAELRVNIVRGAVVKHQRLSKDSIEQDTEERLTT